MLSTLVFALLSFAYAVPHGSGEGDTSDVASQLSQSSDVDEIDHSLPKLLKYVDADVLPRKDFKKCTKDAGGIISGIYPARSCHCSDGYLRLKDEAREEWDYEKIGKTETLKSGTTTQCFKSDSCPVNWMARTKGGKKGNFCIACHPRLVYNKETEQCGCPDTSEVFRDTKGEILGCVVISNDDAIEAGFGLYDNSLYGIRYHACKKGQGPGRKFCHDCPKESKSTQIEFKYTDMNDEKQKTIVTHICE